MPTPLLAWIRSGNPRSLATVPVIYSAGLPLMLLDAWVTLYQRLCFPLYGIEPVRRRAYFVFDRHRLPYLNPIEKAHCTYCSYATGVVAYVQEVIARTETYWCPIRHRREMTATHRRMSQFFPYGDARALRRGLGPLRRTLRRQSDAIERSRAV